MRKSIFLAAALAAVLCTAPLHTGALEPLPPDVFPDIWYGPGDVTMDGQLNIADSVLLQQYLLGQVELTPEQMLLADMDFDGTVDIFDLALLKQAILEQQSIYSKAEFVSPDGSYRMVFSMKTNYRQQTAVTVTWYDPDGDTEQTDHFSYNGTAISGEGTWLNGFTFGDGNYAIGWKEDAVYVQLPPELPTDDGAPVEKLNYPDRTRVPQQFTEPLNFEEAPEISSVDIATDCYGDIERKMNVTRSGHWMVNNAVGIVGTAFQVTKKDSIGAYTVTLHYNEDELRWVPEGNLIVLAYRDEGVQIFQEITDLKRDTEANTLTFTTDQEGYFLLADAYTCKCFGKVSKGMPYEVDDITQYTSDWERSGACGDLLQLADKNWAKENLANSTFTVSSVQELASAVYYINAMQSIEHIVPGQRYKIVLAADLDLSGYTWSPVSDGLKELDGGGHTISHMTVTGGFADQISDVLSVHDVTFTDADVKGRNAGILVGNASYPSTITLQNVHIQGSVASGNAFVGSGSAEIELTDCTAEVMIGGEPYTYPQMELTDCTAEVMIAGEPYTYPE